MAATSSTEASEETAAPKAPVNFAELAADPDRLLDELIPEELDWRNLVRTYPIPALLIAGAGGFFLGTRRGKEVMAAVGAFLSDQMSSQVNQALGGDLL